MPRPRINQPKLCLHKPSGRAFVRLAGKQIWCGKFGTQAASDKYSVVVGEWVAKGRPATIDPPAPTASEPDEIKVVELIDAYWTFAQEYHKCHELRPSGDLNNIRQATRILLRMFGDLPAVKFGPLKLMIVRDEMVKPQPGKQWRKTIDPDTGEPVTKLVDVMRPGWSRHHVNRQVWRIKRMFSWGASRELIPAAIPAALEQLEGLKKGKTPARETAKVRPADEEAVTKVLPFLPPAVSVMVQLGALTGMRPGEIRIMRTGDIDRTGDVWTYTPMWHKTEGHDVTRTIQLGKRAQDILTPCLKLDPDAYLFSPVDAMKHQIDSSRKKPGEQITTAELLKRKRPPKLLYTKDAMNRCIQRALKRAGLPKFTPNQLRHLVATKLRREYDLETAETILGHTSANMTQRYAERDLAKARNVMGQIG